MKDTTSWRHFDLLVFMTLNQKDLRYMGVGSKGICCLWLENQHLEGEVHNSEETNDKFMRRNLSQKNPPASAVPGTSRTIGVGSSISVRGQGL